MSRDGRKKKPRPPMVWTAARERRLGRSGAVVRNIFNGRTRLDAAAAAVFERRLGG